MVQHAAKPGDSTIEVAQNLAIGGGLQVMEAATLGMPLETWKTRNGANPNETAVQSFNAIRNGPNGYKAFWAGLSAKVVESFTKGGVLVVAKELLLNTCENAGMDRKSAVSGTIAGAGGGVAQTIVMSPLTYVVTFHSKKAEEGKRLGTVGILRQAGLRGCYSSAPAMAMRQASNWGLRQGFNDLYAGMAASYLERPLTVPEKVLCGLVGGACACINQPTEVLRIRMQAEHVSGNKNAKTMDVARRVMKEHGPLGFYAGIVPRIGLCAWQTLFMVTIADMVTAELRKSARKH